MEAIYHAEGRVSFDNGQSLYEYNLTDHLGNLRLSFADRNGDGEVDITSDPATNEVLQEHHYYPFGMAMEGDWVDNPVRGNRYRYNGKELEENFGLNWYAYGARYYDPAIGRFTGVDPIADQFAWVTPYNYAENEPVANIDLWGLQRIFYGDVMDDSKFRKANDLRIATNEGIQTNLTIWNTENEEVAHDVYFILASLSSSDNPRANASTTTYTSDVLDDEGKIAATGFQRQRAANRQNLKLNYKPSKEEGNNFSVIVINAEGEAYKNADVGENGLLKLAETIHHEMKAHVNARIESGTIVNPDVKQEHEDYHGRATYTSPPIEQAKEGTPQARFLQEAREILKKNK